MGNKTEKKDEKISLEIAFLKVGQMGLTAEQHNNILPILTALSTSEFKRGLDEAQTIVNKLLNKKP